MRYFLFILKILPLAILLYFLLYFFLPFGDEKVMHYKDKWFSDLECQEIAYFPATINPSYRAQQIVFGYTAYKLNDSFVLETKYRDDWYVVEKENMPEKYAEIYEGIIQTITEVNEPERTIQIMDFLTDNKDDLVFVGDSNYYPVHGLKRNSDSLYVFFLYGFIYSKKVNEIYFIRLYDSNFQVKKYF